MNKDVLRKRFIKTRSALTFDNVEEKSKKIFENFNSCNFKKEIKKVLVYLHIGNEVDTKFLIEYLRLKNISLFLPANINQEWIVCVFESDDELMDGPYGTKQPVFTKQVDVEYLDLAIIPGVAFSKVGFRLGYGKGVYDRLLANFSGIKVGLAYDLQIVGDFSFEDHDVKMDYIITENRIIQV